MALIILVTRGLLHGSNETTSSEPKIFLRLLQKRYGTNGYANVVAGIELINEPISWGNNNLDVTYQFAVDSYWAVRQDAENKDLIIIMHDAFRGLSSWEGLPGRTNSDAHHLGIDTYLYQVYTDEDNALTQEAHIQKACGWASSLRTSKGFMSTYVGEWSAATNICSYPDGTNTPGHTCSVSGCQCQSNTDSSNWQQPMKNAVRRYMEAQLDVFRNASNGYFFWAFKDPGAWSWLAGAQGGWIPQPLSERKYPNQCKF